MSQNYNYSNGIVGKWHGLPVYVIKESEFFNVIGSLDKQVIIVTKSFLKESSNGDLEVDMDKISGVTGTIFRIEKKKPFDDKKLGTIQTIITKIK